MAGARVLAGRYRLRDRLGAGGMGEVWRATDEVLGRTVAVKLILPALLDEPGFARRFLAEARAMASVRHPGVVAIHDFHAGDDGAYLVMEYADGEPVSKVLDRIERIGAAATMDLVRQVALALQAVHDRGIVHRDVKPANLLLRTDGTIALADFGIALGAGNTALTRSGAVLGTPLYLAPEQVMGHPATPRSDVYALGVVAYECLAGRPPFVGENPLVVAMQRVQQPPPPLGPDVPPAVASVVERALAADPLLRWPSAAEFAMAAERASLSLTPGRHSGDWAGATTVPRHGALAALPAARRRPRRGAAIAVAALVLAVLGGATAAVAIWRGNNDQAAAGAQPARSSSTVPAQESVDNPTGESATEKPDEVVPDGFVICGDVLCPAEPMCWAGLVQQGDIALPPRAADCTEPHYWETFAAIPLPAGVETDYDLSHLMDRDDVADVCSEQAVTAAAVTRSRRRSGTATPGRSQPTPTPCSCTASAVPRRVSRRAPRSATGKSGQLSPRARAMSPAPVS